jgi:hypothetical protein
MNRVEPLVTERIVDAIAKCRVPGVLPASILFGAEKTGALKLIDTAEPSVPTSPETVAPRYLCTDGRRMVLKTCPSHPKFLVERSPLRRASASSMSRA